MRPSNNEGKVLCGGGSSFESLIKCTIRHYRDFGAKDTFDDVELCALCALSNDVSSAVVRQ